MAATSAAGVHPVTGRREFIPKDYQTPAVEFMYETPRCLLFSPMGSGKTPMVLTMLNALYNVLDESRPTLILGPKRVATDVWPREVAKWAHLSGLEVATAVGTAAARRRVLSGNAPIVTINYDVLPQLVEELNGKWPFGTIVADECTRTKGFRLRQGGIRTKALSKHAHTDSARYVGLTGTPAPNGLKDLWGQMWFVDGGQRLGRTYSAFMDRWFQVVPGGDGYSQVRELPHAQEEIQALLRDVVYTVDTGLDLRKPLINNIMVDLPPAARKQYREMEKQLFIAFESGEEVEAFGASGRAMKCMQLASGAVYLDPQQYGPDKWMEVHDAKLDALDSIQAEAGGMPLLVSILFKSDRARILKSFKGARDLSEPGALDAFRAGRVPIGVAHPASLGHGVDGLQDATCQIVHFSQGYDLELYDQINERVGPMRQHQSGHDRLCTIHHILARDTLDEQIVERRITKASVQDTLRETMKRRPM